jgi:hypothetical protein
MLPAIGMLGDYAWGAFRIEAGGEGWGSGGFTPRPPRMALAERSSDMAVKREDERYSSDPMDELAGLVERVEQDEQADGETPALRMRVTGRRRGRRLE